MKEEKLEKIREEVILSKVRKMRKERNKMRILEDEVEEEKGGALESKSKKRRIEEAQEDREEDVTQTNSDLGDEDDETWRKEIKNSSSKKHCRDKEELLNG